MTDKATLLLLAERCEAYDPKLSLDNRADEMPLDLAIAKAAGVAEADWQVARGSVTGYFSGDGVGGFGNPIVPRYTRSLDAAMTLVPEGWQRLIGDDPEGGLCSAGLYRDGQDDALALGHTLPLALCAASLRARAAMMEDEGE